LLHQQGFSTGAAGGGQDVPYPPGCGRGGCRVAGAQDALAGAERDRLDHAREPHCRGGLPDGLVGGRGGHDPEGGLGDPGGCPPLPLPRLVGGVPHRAGRVMRQPQLTGDGRGQHEHRGVRGDHGVDRADAGQDAAGAGFRVGWVDRDERAATADRQRAVAADHHIQAHPGRGQQEVGRAVGTGGHQQQYSAPRRRRVRSGGRVRAGHRFSGE
jgi:hypothetical protein